MQIPNITLIQIQYFIQVMDDGNFTRAADNMNVTQSTLSKSISMLEESLNVQLFNRHKKRIIPTEAAKYLYSQWRQLLEQLDESIANSRWLNRSSSGCLRIGTLDSHRPESYLIDYVDRFCESNPGHDVSIESLPPDILFKKLKKHELDIIFTVKYDVEYEDYSHYQVKLIELCPLEACMKPTNPLAKKASITIPDLASCHLIVISSHHVPSYNKMIRNLCAKHNIHPNIQYSTTNASSQIFNLRNSRDIFICDKYHRDYNADKLIFRPVIGTESGVAMVWRPDDNSPGVEKFISMF